MITTVGNVHVGALVDFVMLALLAFTKRLLRLRTRGRPTGAGGPDTVGLGQRRPVTAAGES